MKLLMIGVGGAGCMLTDYLANGLQIDEISYLAIDNDEENLESVSIQKKLLIGSSKTDGDPSIGMRFADENKERIVKELMGYPSAIVIFGGGGDMGTGAGCRISFLAKENKMNTAAMITKPFSFESKARASRTESCIEELVAGKIPVVAIHQDWILSRKDEEKPIKEALDLINWKVLSYVNDVCRKTDVGGDIINTFERNPMPIWEKRFSDRTV